VSGATRQQSSRSVSSKQVLQKLKPAKPNKKTTNIQQVLVRGQIEYFCEKDELTTKKLYICAIKPSYFTTNHNKLSFNRFNAMKNDTESMIIKFLEDLSQYYHQENDLSNITCSICNTSENFKSKFLKFFFPKIDIDDVCEISREVPDCRNAGCRVDIYISMQNDETPYIIEVKIYDFHHHFGTYDHAYQIPKERFGYITNYICREGIDQGYSVKTWEDFYKYLLNFDDNDEITNGYIQYLKNTCDITMYDKPMNAKYLSTIPCFIDSANKIINTQRDWVTSVS
jgi:hypothetical protein